MGEKRTKTVVVVVLVAVSVAAGAGAGLMRRVPPPVASPSTVVTNQPPQIDVHVAGWVDNPGVVTVLEGSIVADAIAAAGGMRAGAKTDSVNLAAALAPGQQIVVPGPDGSGPAPPTGETGGLVSLNLASTSDLETLPGVGPVLAERIVAHRESHGPFQVVEDLLQVPGIGEAKLASLRDLVQP